MNAIAQLLETHRLACQTVLINYGLRLGIVKAIEGNNNVNGAQYALLNVTNSVISNSSLYEEMLLALNTLQIALEKALKPLLVKHFQQLAIDQPHLLAQLKNDYLARLSSKVLFESARGKQQLVSLVLKNGFDPRDPLAVSEQEKEALKKVKEQEKNVLAALEQAVIYSKNALDYARTRPEATLVDIEACKQLAFAAEENLQAELYRVRELKKLLVVEKFNQEIAAFWSAQNLPSLNRSQYLSEAAFQHAQDSQKMAYLADNRAKLDFSQCPLLKNYFRYKSEQHVTLADFILNEFVEEDAFSALSIIESHGSQLFEASLLEAKNKLLLSTVDINLAKTWAAVKGMALQIKLLKQTQDALTRDHSLSEAAAIVQANVVRYPPLVNAEAALVQGLHEIARVHSAPLQLQIENPAGDQVGGSYLQDLPTALVDCLVSTPIKIIKDAGVIRIDYRTRDYLEPVNSNKQVLFIMPVEQPNYQLVLKIKPDRSGVESYELIFDEKNIATLPKPLQKYVETTAQGLFSRLKQLRDEKALTVLIRDYLQTPENLNLLKQVLQYFDDPQFLIAKDQARRIAKVAYDEMKRSLEAGAGHEDLAVSLLVSRHYLEKTAKWYQLVPSKEKSLALIEQIIPSGPSKLARNANELSHYLIREHGLIKRHQDFFNKNFMKNNGLTQKTFAQIVTNRIKELTTKDLSKRLSAQYSLSRLLNDTRTVMIADKKVCVKEAVLQQLLMNPLNQSAQIKSVLVEKLARSCQDGQLTADGLMILKDLLKHDQRFTLFSDVLKGTPLELIDAIKKSISQGVFFEDYRGDISSGFEFLSKFRQHYHAMKKHQSRAAKLNFDYPDMLSLLAQPFIPVLLAKAKNTKQYQTFWCSLTDEQLPECVASIDQFISHTFSSLESFLEFFKSTPQQSCVEKLASIKNLCGFEATLKSRLQSKIQVMLLNFLRSIPNDLTNNAIEPSVIDELMTYVKENFSETGLTNAHLLDCVPSIDQFITNISSTLENFLDFIKPSSQQTSAEKLACLKAFCRVDDDLTLRLQARIQSMFLAAIQATADELGMNAIDSFVTLELATYIDENLPEETKALCKLQIKNMIQDEIDMNSMSLRLQALQKGCSLIPALKRYFDFCYKNEPIRRALAVQQAEQRCEYERRQKTYASDDILLGRQLSPKPFITLPPPPVVHPSRSLPAAEPESTFEFDSDSDSDTDTDTDTDSDPVWTEFECANVSAPTGASKKPRVRPLLMPRVSVSEPPLVVAVPMPTVLKRLRSAKYTLATVAEETVAEPAISAVFVPAAEASATVPATAVALFIDVSESSDNHPLAPMSARYSERSQHLLSPKFSPSHSMPSSPIDPLTAAVFPPVMHSTFFLKSAGCLVVSKSSMEPNAALSVDNFSVRLEKLRSAPVLSCC